MKTINVGILGLGTVGAGVVKLLLENQSLIISRVGACLNLKKAADIDVRKEKELSLPKGVFVNNANLVVNDPEIDIIVEMIGGEKLAGDLILKAIENNKPVVTANKALLARHGNALVKASEKQKVDLMFEASVGGAMPIIKTIRESLVGNQIKSVSGILNGTCNYILSKISDNGTSFEDALAEAQASGCAEADPGLDVNGLDTAHKLAIVTALAYGMKINFDDIYIEGITNIAPLDIQFAAQFGYRIKLMAISKNLGHAIEARVHPTMIPFENILSNVNGTLNAVTITGDEVGEILLSGLGAGMMPTASAVVGDIVDLARNIMANTRARIPLLAHQPGQIRAIPVLPIDKIITHYYFRFAALDRPGVLSTISGILGNYGISLKSVHQKGRKSSGSVPLIMLTHRALEADVISALKEISALEVIQETPILIRIEDKNSIN